MPSTSKSHRRKPKTKFFLKLMQQWRVKEQKKNWLELPSDVMANILYRVGVFDILENAQKVCTTWHKICKDPAMWRVISMKNHSDPNARPPLQEMCKHAVDRSQGQLVDLTLDDFANHELLLYIAERASELKRLDISSCYGELYDGWTDFLRKFPKLEELSVFITHISKEDIEGAGRFCPKLRTLKINREFFRFPGEDTDEMSLSLRNEIAIAIGKNLPDLKHLELMGNTMSNIGLEAILDGCGHLESLDLRQCVSLDLKGDIGKKLSEKIKCVKVPKDSLAGCRLCEGYVDAYSDGFLSGFRDEYDDYTDPFHSDYMNNFKPDLFDSEYASLDIAEVEDKMTSMALFGDLLTER